MRSMVVLLYHYSPARIASTQLAIVKKQELSVYFKCIPHKIELLGPFLWIMALVRKEAFYNPFFGANAVVGVSRGLS